MKRQTNIESLGTMDFSNIELTNSIEIYINIADLSEDLKADVEKAIEREKKIHNTREKRYMDIWKQSWCKEGVKTTPQLHIILPEDGKIQYDLTVFFQDLLDEDLTDSAVLKIDLINHIAELKKLIIHVLIERFF